MATTNHAPPGDRLGDALRRVDELIPIDGYVALAEPALRTVGETVLQHLPPGAHVLDFGAGRCAKAAVVAELGFRCAAYDDLADPHLTDPDRAAIRAFAAAAGVELTVAPYGGELPYAPETFDLAMLHDVLEHLPQSPRQLLNQVLELVRPGGVLFVTVPNAANLRKRIAVLRGRTNLPDFDHFFWHPEPWRGHVREYVRDDLARLAANLGLEVVELSSCHHMLAKMPAPARPLYRAATRVFPGWRDTWLLVARRPAGWIPAKDPPASFDVNRGRLGYWDG